MQIVRTSKGFSILNTEDGLIYRTLGTFQDAENWRAEAKSFEEEDARRRR